MSLRDSVVIRTWAAEVLLMLGDGPKRFNPMLHGIAGVSDRILSERLRELEAAGLVDRQVLVGPPVRVIYGLTVAGRRYIEPLQSLAAIDAQTTEEVAQAV